MTTKTLSKTPPKPAAISKKKAAIQAPTAAIEQAYSIEFTPEARKKLGELTEALDYLTAEAARASGITVADDLTQATAGDATVNLTKARKAVEDLQKFFTTPFESTKKGIIARFKEWLRLPLEQENRLRDEGGRYFMKKRDEQLAEERRRQEEQAERDRKARQLGRVSAPPLPEPEPVAVERVVEGENGTVGFGTEWVFELVDITRVPETFLSREINKKAVDGAIAGGARQIEGLRIFERPKSSVR